MVGIKRISWAIHGDYCPFYRKDEEYKWRRRNRRHEEVVMAVLDKLREIHGAGLNCIRECGLSLGDQRGRPDLLCWCRGLVIMVEAKSVPVERASIHDMYQLLLYAEMLVNENGVVECRVPGEVLRGVRTGSEELVLYLAYRNESGAPILIRVDTSVSDTPRLDELSSMYRGIRGSGANTYVLGPWCFTCSNRECPVARSMGRE